MGDFLMTDEERHKFLDKLYKFSRESWYGGAGPACKEAAVEIERLVEELKLVESENEHHIRLAFIDAGANPAVTWKQEAERLAALNEALHLMRGSKATPSSRS